MEVGQERVSSAEVSMLSAKVAELESTLQQVQDSVLNLLSQHGDEWTDSFYPSQLDIPGGDGGEAYYV